MILQGTIKRNIATKGMLCENPSKKHKEVKAMSLSNKIVKALMLAVIVSVLLSESGCIFNSAEKAYAASRKKKSSGRKNSKSSNASSSPDFWQIINEYKANPEAAKKKWLNKTIYMRGTLMEANTLRGQPSLFLFDPKSLEGGVYLFSIFKNTSSLVDFSNFAAAKMSIGEKIKLKGKVYSIKKVENDSIAVLCINSEFVNTQTWRCSKCGQYISKVAEGSNMIDLMSDFSKCKYGGSHNWKKIR